MTGFDVKAAFLYGKLDKEIYIKQPEGFALKGQEPNEAKNIWFLNLKRPYMVLNKRHWPGGKS